VRSLHGSTSHAIALSELPLPFPALRKGEHVLRFSYPSLFKGARWSRLENAVTSKAVSPAVASSNVFEKDGRQWLTFLSPSATVVRHIGLRPGKPGDHFTLAGSYIAPVGAVIQITLAHPGTNEFIVDLHGNGTRIDYHINQLFEVARSPDDKLYVLYYPPAKHAGSTSAAISIDAVPGMVANVVLSQGDMPTMHEVQLQPSDLGFNRHEIGEARRIVQYDQTYNNAWQLSDASEHFSSSSGFNVWVRRGEAQHATITYRTGFSYTVAAFVSLFALCVLGLLSIRAFWSHGAIWFQTGTGSALVKEETF
jgi:hypothetical protein